MGDNSKIEWTDASWNVVTGCTKVSPGCDFCYAERVTNRFAGPGAFDRIVVHPDRLDLPLRWRRPRKIFVNSMSDVFHDEIPDELVAKMFAVMALAGRHTFQVLTKRHGRMRTLLSSTAFEDLVDLAIRERMMTGTISEAAAATAPRLPLPNVWLGVSVEDQKWADIRIPALAATPAAVRFLSCEPLLGPVSLDPHLFAFCRREDERCPRAAKQWGEWVPAERSRATHLLHERGSLTTMAAGTSMQSYGSSSPTEQDLIDRGHEGWVRVRKVGKKFAGRDLDGRTWDEWPAVPEPVPA